MKRKRPVLYELVRKLPRDAASRPRSPAPAAVPPAPPPAPAARPSFSPPSPSRAVAESDPSVRATGVRPGLSSVVATSGSGARPLYVRSRDGAAVLEKLLVALRKWGQNIQSAPPWATVLGLVASIAFFVFICFRIYAAFVVKDAPSPQTDNTVSPPAVTSPGKSDVGGTSRREVPSIGGGSRVATPNRGNDGAAPAPEQKPEVVKPLPKEDAAAPPLPEVALPAVSGQFEKGTYYVHVQHFGRGKRDEAIAAHQFLRSEGIACSLVDTKADLAILLDEPYQLGVKDAKQRSAEQKRVEEMKKRIRDLGKKYVKNAGGKYSFRDCVEKAY